jgi:hypothetical protein
VRPNTKLWFLVLGCRRRTTLNMKPRWARVRAGVIVGTSILAELSTKARIEEGIKQAAHESGVVTEVAHAGQLGSVEYWRQGDLSLQADDVVTRRAHLRHHGAVVDVLQLWWETALHSRRYAGLRDEAQHIGKADYMRLNRLISKATLRDWNERSANKLAAREWANDVRGGAHMFREAFMEGTRRRPLSSLARADCRGALLAVACPSLDRLCALVRAQPSTSSPTCGWRTR